FAGLVGGGQVDLGPDAPVVVAVGVVEDLPHRPGLATLLDDQHGGGAGLRAGAEMVVLVEVVLDGLPPAGGVPAVGPVQLPQFDVGAAGGQLDPAEQGVAHHDGEAAQVGGDAAGGGGRPDLPGQAGLVLVGVGQGLPLVEQAGVDTADEFAEPGDEVRELLGA